MNNIVREIRGILYIILFFSFFVLIYSSDDNSSRKFFNEAVRTKIRGSLDSRNYILLSVILLRSL